MRGQQELIKMRMARQTPASVCLYDFPMDTEWVKWGETPRVTVNGEPVVDLDLRFVVGMTVMIESHDSERAKELFDKCVSAGAKIVAASSYPDFKDDPYSQTPSSTIFHFRDKA
jgi:hypothetical protein